MRKGLAVAALLLASAAGPAAAYHIEKLSGVGTLAAGKSIDVVAEEAMVKFSSSVTASGRSAALSRIGAGVTGEFPAIGWTWVKLPAGMRVADGLKALKLMPEVSRVTPNHIYKPNKVPNDILVAQQNNLSQIDAFGAWEYETGFSSAVTIAMIDTGLDGGHVDLASKILHATGAHSQDCSGGTCNSEDTPVPACNHGTRTSGIAAAAANNSIGIAGMSWGAKLVSLKVFPDSQCGGGSGDCAPVTCGATDAALVSALQYATNMNQVSAAGKIVINMSIGSENTPCVYDDLSGVGADAVRDAIAVSTTAGIPVIISAGNDGGSVNAPANCAGTSPGSGIIPVGAVDSSNNIAYFSSQGPELAANGVVAPGVNVETTDVGSTYTGGASGTSFSAPQVVGLAALILSARPDCQNCAVYVQSVIRGGAHQIGTSSNSSGAGIINAFRSMRLAVRGTAAFDGDQKAIAFPNPFRVSQAGSVSFSVPTNLQGANASIKIYTIGGEYVRTITGLTWDGKNATGNLVASGTYIFVVSTDNGTTRGRVAVIR